MSRSLLRRLLFVLAVMTVVVISDQWSKVVVRERIIAYEEIPVLGEYFILTRAENTGAFLSLGAEMGPIWRQILLVYLPVLTMLILVGYVVIKQDLPRGLVLALSLLAGGGVGNLIDRIRFGSVTDFFHIDLGFVRTGIFNVADMAITAGAIVMLFYSFRRPAKSDPDPAATDEAAPTAGHNP